MPPEVRLALDGIKQAAYYELLTFVLGEHTADPDLDLVELLERMKGHIEDSIVADLAPLTVEFNPAPKDS